MKLDDNKINEYLSKLDTSAIEQLALIKRFDDYVKTINTQSATITKTDSDGNDDWYGEFFKCPSCSKTWIIKAFKFCPMCGISITFEKEV